MSKDSIIVDLLTAEIKSLMRDFDFTLEDIQKDAGKVWSLFVSGDRFRKNFCEIQHLITSIAKNIDRSDKLKCQYCRIDEGFLVDSPVVAHNLCKKHRQEYEEQFIDKTLTQIHPAIVSSFSGEEGMHCSAPPRRR